MRPNSSKALTRFHLKARISDVSKRALLFVSLMSLCGLSAEAADDTNQKGAAQLVKDLNSASSITLLSIDSPSAATRKKKEFSVIHGYEILGHTEIAKGETAKISKLVGKQIGAGYQTKCIFQPHHALLVDHDKHKSELVICFTCGDVRYYRDGDDMGMLTVLGGSDSTGELEKTLNAMLVKGKVPQSAYYLKQAKEKQAGKGKDYYAR